MLNIDNLTCRRGPQLVLNQVSLSLGTGEIGAVMGANGIGKSTLLQAVAGFVPVDSGSICFGKHVLATADWSQEPAKREVGMVFQDLALFPHLNSRDNLLFGVSNLSKGDQNKRLAEVNKLVKADELLDKFPYELSGGEQQRIAIGRTLITRKPMMLFDEPFANLDVSLKREMSFTVRDYLNKYKITALVVSHDRAEAINVCDKIGVLEKGGQLTHWHDKREELTDLLPLRED